MPELLLPCCDVELLPFAALCCVLPEDEAEFVLPPLLLALPLLLVLLWLLLALLVLLELWLSDGAGVGAGAGALAADDGAGEGAGAGVGVGAGALCTLLLALCDASFCESMLCCKVCENGWLFTMSTGELVCELSDEPNSELIYESGDMADPVYPVSPVKFRSVPVKRLCAQAPAGAGHVVMQARGLHTLGAHPENSCGMFVGVALLAPRHLLGFRRIAACLQYFVGA